MGLLLSGCDGVGGSADPSQTFDYEFSTSTHQFEAFFTGYPVGKEEEMELTASHEPLPESVEASGKGLYIHGFNESDNVKMLFRRRITDLASDATYHVRFRVRFATNAPSDCPGIGGSPGEAVKVLATAEPVKPRRVVVDDPDPYNWLNVQRQAESPQEWYQGALLGHIANGRECEESDRFRMKTLTSGSAHDTLQTGSNGEAWLLFGTRSGFEGPTSLYYTQFEAELRRK